MKPAEELVADARRWWTTRIVDIEPGKIAMHGYPIEQLIGRVGYAEMAWLMLRGELPSQAQGALLEAALVAGVDHGPQAPSIAISRMATSCGLPVNGAMASAINALDDVHGGAGQQCMELMQGIDAAAPEGATADQVAQALDAWQAQHGKIVPGFGHRFHTRDPRAARLFQMALELEMEGEHVQMIRAVEMTLNERDKSGHPLPVNIDGAIAAVCGDLGIPPPVANALFIISRVPGIAAQAREEFERYSPMRQIDPKDHVYDGPSQRRLPERRK